MKLYVYCIVFVTIGLTFLHHHFSQIKNINYDSSLFDGFAKEQFIQELGISQEWILGIVLKLLVTLISGLILLDVMVLKVIN